MDSDGLVRVVIADDQAPFRRIARAVVEAVPGFMAVGEAGSGQAAVALARSLRPDLVLLDINMPCGSGIEAARRITAARPQTVAVLISTYAGRDLPGEALACGASAYLHKDELGPGRLTRIWEDSRPDGG